MRSPRLFPAFCSIFLAGCSGWQSVLDPQSGQAHDLARLFWFFTIVCAAVWLLVVAALFVTAMRRHDIADMPEEDTLDQKRRKKMIVGALVIATAGILAVFTLTSFYATRGFAWAKTNTLAIKITGKQWWWQVQYRSNNPSQIFTTANEIHIPVGRPVTLDLESSDVIHSFWLPNLMGKQNLIPGHKNELTIEADHPGLYRAQCAEFCGSQHAHMAMYVFAEPQPQFEQWRKHQLQSASPPQNALQASGLHVFLAGRCASCHTITGTSAGGQLGPNLSHFGSRATIAASLLHNTPQNLLLWIFDLQGLKPACVG